MFHSWLLNDNQEPRSRGQGVHSGSQCQCPFRTGWKTPTSERGNFSILAVDGGGTRGIYAAQILARVEEALGQTVKDCFDLLAGTSTGSIIAGAAAAGIPLGEVVGLFERESPRIFGRARFPSLISVFLRSRYSRATLEKVLQEYLPQTVLRDVSTPLMITSADITTGGVHVFKSRYLGDLGEPYERDGDVLLRDAILASCAAPTYFDPKAVGPYLLTDGGLWANNPSIIALTEAISKFKKEVAEVRVFVRRHWTHDNHVHETEFLGPPDRMGREQAGLIHFGASIPGFDEHGKADLG